MTNLERQTRGPRGGGKTKRSVRIAAGRVPRAAKPVQSTSSAAKLGKPAAPSSRPVGRTDLNRPARPPNLLITAGPTHEPIDDVRYLGNRSSGRVGVELADAAARLGWRATLLLGPSAILPSDSRVKVVRFRTTADLQKLLTEFFPKCGVLVMAAAVADYRPVVDTRAVKAAGGKLRRDAAGMTINLEATPDLLAGLKSLKREGQFVVGFALEPAVRLMTSAREKLARKGLDAIVANELETMNSASIEATLIRADGTVSATGGAISKRRFATWLLRQIARTRA